MNFENLENIHKVEVSPFLFTRIKQRISNDNTGMISSLQIKVIILSLIAILCLNLATFINYSKSDNSLESYANLMHLTSDNTIYK